MAGVRATIPIPALLLLIACGGASAPTTVPAPATSGLGSAAGAPSHADLAEVLAVANGFTATSVRVRGRMTVRWTADGVARSDEYDVEVLAARGGALRLTAADGFEMASDGRRLRIRSGGRVRELDALDMPVGYPQVAAEVLAPLDIVELLLPAVLPESSSAASPLALESRSGAAVVTWFHVRSDGRLAIRRRVEVDMGSGVLRRAEWFDGDRLRAIATYVSWNPSAGTPTGGMTLEWPGTGSAVAFEIVEGLANPPVDARTFRLPQ